MPSRWQGLPAHLCFAVSTGSLARPQWVFASGAMSDGDRFEVSSGRAPARVRGVRGAECLELGGSRQELSARCPVPCQGLIAVPVLVLPRLHHLQPQGAGEHWCSRLGLHWPSVPYGSAGPA